MSETAKALMAKARESLASAKAGSCGRSPERSEQSSLLRHVSQPPRAALEMRGIATAGQRHGTIVSRFGRTFVKRGPLDAALGRAFNKTLELRKEGDYDLASPDADDVRAALRDAEALVEAIAKLCRRAPTFAYFEKSGRTGMPYAIITRDKPNSLHLRNAARAEHLEYLTRHQDKLLAAGAMTDDDGQGGYGGIIIVDTEDRAEAEAFIRNDPFTEAGLFSGLEVVRWRKAFFDKKRLI